MPLTDIHTFLEKNRSADNIVFIAGGTKYTINQNNYGELPIREVYSHTAIGQYTNPVRLLLSCVDNDLCFSKTQLTNNYIFDRGFLICDIKE